MNTSLHSPLLTALIRITKVILLNKPIYPIYVWYFVGEGVKTSLLTVATAPAYILILLIARRSSLAARVAFSMAATADTLFETKIFGATSATELFAAPAALIAALSFSATEARWQKAILAAMYGIFVVAHGRIGAPLYPWTDDSAAHLREINIFAVASLTVFVGWTFAGQRNSASEH